MDFNDLNTNFFVIHSTLVRIIRFRKKKDSKSVVSVTRGPVGTEVSG